MGLLVQALVLPVARAQGGPPMVTDDPDTPGDGHWEINLAAIAQRTDGARSLSAPDADINYGWGEHLQLKADLPWGVSQPRGRSWRSGAGDGNFGVKWRLIDEEDRGFALSTYPQYEHSLGRASIDNESHAYMTGRGPATHFRRFI